MSEISSEPVQNWEVRKIGQANVVAVTGDKLSALITNGTVGAGHEVRLQGSSEWLTVAQATPFITPRPARPAVPVTPATPPPNPPAAGRGTSQRWTTDESSTPPAHPPASPKASTGLPTIPPPKRDRRAPLTETEDDELDMTPMIDMTFLLLIFFMVTSTISPFADLQLPEAKAGDAEKPEGRVVLVLDYDKGHTIDDKSQFSGSEFIELKDCQIYLGNDNQNAIPPDKLQEFLVEAFAQNGGGEFILQSNRKMPVGVVREVINVAKASGAGQTMIGVARPR